MKKLKHKVNGDEGIKEAAALINKVAVARRDKCAAELDTILQKYGYTLQIGATPIILAKRNTSGGP